MIVQWRFFWVNVCLGPGALCKADVASSPEVSQGLLTLQKRLAPAASADGSGLPAKCQELEIRVPDFYPRTLGLRSPKSGRGSVYKNPQREYATQAKGQTKFVTKYPLFQELSF